MTRNEGLVGDRVRRNFGFLYRLGMTKSPQKRYRMVQEANRDEILAIVEICKNVLKETFKLSKSQSRKLYPFQEHAKTLSKVRSPSGAIRAIQKGEGIVSKGRKRQVVQKGGLLPALVVPILVELAAEVAERALDHFLPEGPSNA